MISGRDEKNRFGKNDIRAGGKKEREGVLSERERDRLSRDWPKTSSTSHQGVKLYYLISRVYSETMAKFKTFVTPKHIYKKMIGLYNHCAILYASPSLTACSSCYHPRRKQQQRSYAGSYRWQSLATCPRSKP